MQTYNQPVQPNQTPVPRTSRFRSIGNKCMNLLDSMLQRLETKVDQWEARFKPNNNRHQQSQVTTPYSSTSTNPSISTPSSTNPVSSFPVTPSTTPASLPQNLPSSTVSQQERWR